jgi:flagellar assembly factor FliW
MKIATAKYGEIQLDDRLIFTFEQPLLGLEDYHRYGLVQEDKSLPFAYLQALEEPRICLLLGDPFAFYPDYEFELSEENREALGNPAPDATSVWTTVSVRDDLMTATTNLLAPILLNMDAQKGCQIVLHNNKFETRMPLFATAKGDL